MGEGLKQPLTKSRTGTWAVRVISTLVILFLLFLLAPTILVFPWIIEFVWRLASGWIVHPFSNLTAIHWDPLTIALSLTALGLGSWLLHRFIRAVTAGTWTGTATIDRLHLHGFG